MYPKPDPLVSACRTVALLIAANKPVYPIYIWALVGSGAWASVITALSLPLWLAIALLGGRFKLTMRISIPLLGALDAIVATKLFGPQGGAELFFAPCALLALAAFRADEAGVSRVLTVVLFVAFIATHGRYGEPWHIWSSAELASLATINAIAVASLMAFLGWSFAGLPRG